MATNAEKPESLPGQAQPVVGLRPITVSMSDGEDTQVIAALEGMLTQQTRYTNNAVRECMRLRAIIATCDRCRSEANIVISETATNHGGAHDTDN